MKALLICSLLLVSFYGSAQYVGPPNNVGREYGNPKMPLMVSHLAGANKKMLERANKNSKHSIFGKVLCFRRLCRIQSGHPASLRAISFKKFRKKVAKNAKKGAYKKAQSDSPNKIKSVTREPAPVVIDSGNIAPASPVIKADSLIILGAEVLFESGKSTLRVEHFESLKSIVDYLVSHPERSVLISGHTDNTGNESSNMPLSRRRADVVAEFLVNNGVDIDHVQAMGLGSSKPIATNTTNDGRRQNRRVELLIRDRK